MRKLELIVKKEQVAGTRIKNGGLQNTSSGYTLGTEGIQEEAGTTKEKLDGHCQRRSEGYGGSYLVGMDEAEELATHRAEWRQRVIWMRDELRC